MISSVRPYGAQYSKAPGGYKFLNDCSRISLGRAFSGMVGKVW